MRTQFCISQISGPALSHLTGNRSHFAFCRRSFTKLAEDRPALFLLPRLSYSVPNFALSFSRSFSATFQLAMSSFFKIFLGPELEKTSAQRSLTPGQSVYLFANVSEDAVVADTATLSDTGTLGSNFLRRKLHSHDLPRSEEVDKIAISTPAIHQQPQIFSCFYRFVRPDSRKCPKTTGRLLLQRLLGVGHKRSARCTSLSLSPSSIAP